MLFVLLILVWFGFVLTIGKALTVERVSFCRGDECFLQIGGELKKFTFYGYDKQNKVVLLKDDEGENFMVDKEVFRDILVK